MKVSEVEILGRPFYKGKTDCKKCGRSISFTIPYPYMAVWDQLCEDCNPVLQVVTALFREHGPDGMVFLYIARDE